MNTREIEDKLVVGLREHSTFGKGYTGYGSGVQAVELVKKVWTDHPILISEFEERVREAKNDKKSMSRYSVLSLCRSILLEHQPKFEMPRLDELDDDDFK